MSVPICGVDPLSRAIKAHWFSLDNMSIGSVLLLREVGQIFALDCGLLVVAHTQLTLTAGRSTLGAMLARD